MQPTLLSMYLTGLVQSDSNVGSVSGKNKFLDTLVLNQTVGPRIFFLLCIISSKSTVLLHLNERFTALTMYLVKASSWIHWS